MNANSSTCQTFGKYPACVAVPIYAGGFTEARAATARRRPALGVSLKEDFDLVRYDTGHDLRPARKVKGFF